MISQKIRYKNRLIFFKKNMNFIIILQSYVRMWIQRRKFIEKKRYFFENVKKN
jgi:hypothetical protein